MIRAVCLSSFLLLFINVAVYADSAISTSGKEVKQAATTVNFVIRVPYKMTVTSTAQKVSVNSNTGNLLIVKQQARQNRFISQNKPINYKQGIKGQFTVASP